MLVLSACMPYFRDVDLDGDRTNPAQVGDLILNDGIKLCMHEYAKPFIHPLFARKKRRDLALLLKIYGQFLLEDDP